MREIQELYTDTLYLFESKYLDLLLIFYTSLFIIYYTSRSIIYSIHHPSPFLQLPCSGDEKPGKTEVTRGLRLWDEEVPPDMVWYLNLDLGITVLYFANNT